MPGIDLTSSSALSRPPVRLEIVPPVATRRTRDTAAAWKPWRSLLGAYIFGGVTILQLHAQAFGVSIPAQYLSMLPYLATIIVLVLISRDKLKLQFNAPASLGKVFYAAS